jgi:cellulose biosynthesis protein BcsQ
MKVVGIYNIKGGVGKTSTAVNLAWLAARDGMRTLLWDLDPQAAATFYLRVKPKVKKAHQVLAGKLDPLGAVKGSDFDGLDLLPADFAYRNMDILFGGAKKPRRQLRRMLAPLADEYDIILLDCAPSISLVSENVFRASDALLVPLIPATLSVRTLGQLLDFLEGEGLDTGSVWPFFSMVDRRKKLHREIMDNPPEQRVPFLEAYVPHLSAIERMGVERAPVGNFSPGSTAASSYRKLWREVAGRMGLG